MDTKLSALIGQNPWWKDPLQINEDQEIVKWNNTMRYEPKLLGAVRYDFSPNNTVVYSLRGPRQVGKTTLVKLRIKRFLNDGVPPLSILYYAMDQAGGPQDMVDLVDGYARYTRRLVGRSRRYIFLDEISAVQNWQTGIKWLVDVGRLKNATVMVIGSHTLDVKNAAELLPGRRGEVSGGHRKTLRPMSFLEYVSVLDPGLGNSVIDCIPTRDARASTVRNLARGKIDERMSRLVLYYDDLNALLGEYMVTGGIPKIVDWYAQNNTLSEPDYAAYLDTLTGEWHKMRKNTVLLRRFGRGLVSSMGSSTSWSRLAKTSGLGGPDTASDYTDTLERFFMLATVYGFDEEGGHPLLNAEKKIYVSDPYFFHMLRKWTAEPAVQESSIEFLDRAENRGRMLECVVANHLIRLASEMAAKKSTFDHRDHVFHWAGKKRRKVDFVFNAGRGMKMAIDVKPDNPGKGVAAVRALARATGAGGVVLSEGSLDEMDGHLAVPASAFLVLAG